MWVWYRLADGATLNTLASIFTRVFAEAPHRGRQKSSEAAEKEGEGEGHMGITLLTRIFIFEVKFLWEKKTKSTLGASFINISMKN